MGLEEVVTAARSPWQSPYVSGINLLWEVDVRWQKHAELTEGTYILRTNVSDWTHEELWKTYIQRG